ncbi:hypothetical protein J2T07_002582 [Luteibacter jiangsuensis]|uniref:Uncharacterized protein n=1 Tax=Luteibacter jiangsuensis TaxID=637577 RepID=A0ABT9T2H9_9GAMM|nr:hypothetical protein [Luteibacter jiangsuensis]
MRIVFVGFTEGRVHDSDAVSIFGGPPVRRLTHVHTYDGITWQRQPYGSHHPVPSHPKQIRAKAEKTRDYDKDVGDCVDKKPRNPESPQQTHENQDYG